MFNVIVPSTSWVVRSKINSGESFAVFFHMTGCGHCADAEHVLNQEVLPQLSISVYGINLAHDVALAGPLNVEATPTLVVFSDGEPAGRLDGSQDAATYLSLLSGASTGDEEDQESEEDEEGED